MTAVPESSSSPVRLTADLLRKLNSFSIEEKICFALDDTCSEKMTKSSSHLSDMKFDDPDALGSIDEEVINLDYHQIKPLEEENHLHSSLSSSQDLHADKDEALDASSEDNVKVATFKWPPVKAWHPSSHLKAGHTINSRCEAGDVTTTMPHSAASHLS